MSFKMFGQLEEKVKQLVLEGYSANYIANQTGITGDTVLSWCKKNGLISGNYRNPEYKEKELKFIELMKKDAIIKQACKIVGVDWTTGARWATRNGFEHLLRSKQVASIDKRLTLEESNKRLPEGHGVVVSYDELDKKYVIKRDNGTFYKRITSQIFRGDPKLSKLRRFDEKEISDKLLDFGYELIPGTYRTKNDSLQAKHILCGYVRENEFRMIFKQSCPRCNNIGTSKEELSVDLFVQSLGLETNKFRFKKECKGRGKGKEIDIFIKDLNLGIEYCGLYSHGEKERAKGLENKIKRFTNKGKIYVKNDYDSPKLFHKVKLEKAERLGIELITLFSNEWKNSNEKVKAILRAKLGKNKIKIHARKTEIKEIGWDISKEFMDKYHLQGYGKSLISFGIFYKNELVGAITGNHHHMGNGEFVVNRLCFKENITVMGGSGKLMNAVELWALKNKFFEIKTWSDNRWSNGNVYKAIGYILQSELEPTYMYFNNKGETFSKHNFTKEKLKEMGGIGETEWEMAQSLKLDRIWDCGKKTWVKKLL